METKALFLDLDGTLLNDEKEISQKNKEAIDKALLAGHKIIINTGRPLESAIGLAKRLGLTWDGCYLVSFNGGVLYDVYRKHIISKITLPIELAYKVFAEANRRGIHVQTYDDHKVLVEPRCEDYPVKRYCGIVKMDYEVLPDIHSFKEDPVKVLAIDLADHDYLDEFRIWCEQEVGDVLDVFYSNPSYLEIVAKGINKGKALTKLSEMIGIPIENTIAAGDEANDLMMIKAAGLGVAMKNATEETKAVADYITEHDNNHDGIAEIIRKFMLDEQSE